MPTARRRLQPHEVAAALEPRDGLVAERLAEYGTFEQAEGPFQQYSRSVEGQHETIRYRLALPWFGWVFAPLVKRYFSNEPKRGEQPWWAPPDRLAHHHVVVLGMLAAASLAVGYINTLFTQTITFAADEFGSSKGDQGTAAAFVRAGILLVIPLAVLADRLGRRRVIVWCAVASPVLAATGALAPNLVTLTVSQALARPVALCMDVLVAVVAAEVMPRNSRAYAVAVLSLATGFGAGIAVVTLSLADFGESAWRLVYVVALIWLVVAVSLARRLPESPRFLAPHAEHPATPRTRLMLMCTVAFFGNIFVAPASVFQNDYLRDLRGYDAKLIAVFTLSTATPAFIGIVAGGRLADRVGRRVIGACAVVGGSALILLSYTVSGVAMWFAAAGGAVLGGASVPALAVYRAELFPTGRRSIAGLLVTISALISGSIALRIVGGILEDGTGHGAVFSTLLIGQFIVAAVVLARFPETAHRELEELNPQDQQATR